ncbi:MAG TPA: barstar family protein [Pinirhizobacter sp.]|uniref:barstar family protein n=1 Tax=Pinirhizobacter sp. TaxID=2950432 RepID=UPI002B78C649|nr:barstar family protein [Pinirhizobacter sp.]HMH66521.1 barstar family protein [Pinirhizobacter sp.]
MNPLLGIDLNDAASNGVFFVTQDDIAALNRAAQSTSLRTLPVDLHHCTDKASLLRHLDDALHFPAGFGGNWDALSDSLRDLSWLNAKGYLLLIMHAETLREADETEFDIFLDILDEAAESWRTASVPFFACIALPESAADEADA